MGFYPFCGCGLFIELQLNGLSMGHTNDLFPQERKSFSKGNYYLLYGRLEEEMILDEFA